MLEQAHRLIAENLRTKNPYLDLGNCGLTNLNELPDLFDCEHLETLVLSNSWFEFEKREIGIKRSQNKGAPNNLIKLPPQIYILSNLTKLICAGEINYLGRITDISFWKDLKSLTSLDLSFNRITNISFLKDLKYLTHLYLDYNEITDISFLEDLKDLSCLHLRLNQITDISYLKDLNLN